MWPCQRCTVQNPPSSSECEVCSLPRHATEDHSQSWQCTHCCQFNPLHSALCTVCDRPRDSPDGAAGMREKPAKGLEEKKRRSKPQQPETVSSPGRDSKSDETNSEKLWQCKKPYDGDVCDAINGSNVFRCKQCDAAKPYLQHLLTEVTRDLAESKLGTRSNTPGSSERPEDMHYNSEIPWPEDKRGGAYRSASGDRSASPVTQEASATSEDLKAQTVSPSWLDVEGTQQDDGEVIDFPDQECRLVLVGRTGNGKSSTANTILGLDGRFHFSGDFASTTKKCQRHNNCRFGIRLEVVDTPGLFDTELDQDTITKEITKCLGIISPGPHAILLVLRIGVRFTEEENKAIEEVHKLFGVQLLRFLVIVFTHGDELGKDMETDREATLKSMLDKSPDKLKELVKHANGRYVVFDNTASRVSKNEQVRQLLLTIKRLLKVNGGKPYTNKLLEKVEHHMLEREGQLQEKFHGRGRRRRSGGHYSVTSFQWRDIARDEIVQERPLLDRIKAEILPLLLPFLRFLCQLLMGKVLGAAVKGGNCILQ